MNYFVILILEAKSRISPTDSVYLTEQVGVVVAVVVFDAAVVGTEFVTIFIVGVGKLFTISYPGFGFDIDRKNQPKLLLRIGLFVGICPPYGS